MGTPFNDVIYGDNARNTLEGAGGHDRLYGLGSNDTLYGGTHNNPYRGTGNDVLSGGAGSDIMYGGDGNDRYYVDTMLDKVIEFGGQGTDHVYSSVSTSYKWLPANVENLTLSGTAYRGGGNDLNNSIYGNASVNALSGYGGNDYLYGYGGNDTLNGGTGNDLLNGGSGIDKLYGDSGNDYLSGGTGKDTLSGGAGKDTFDFDSVNESPGGGQYDLIADFTKEKWEWDPLIRPLGNLIPGDQIDLSTIDALVSVLEDANQSFKPEQLSYDSSTGVLTADVYGGDDLQVKVVGVDGLPVAGFSTYLDVIA